MTIDDAAQPDDDTAYSPASFTVEVFAYVLTPDIDEYDKHQAEIYLALDEVVTSSGVELA